MDGAGVALRRSPKSCVFFRSGLVRPLALIGAAALLMQAPGTAKASEPVVPAATSGMIYVDPALTPTVGRGGGRSLLNPAEQHHAIYRSLRDALDDYRSDWGMLPQVEIAQGPLLRPGQAGDRVERLRERLGLDPEGPYDSQLEDRVREFQSAHGLPADGVAGRNTIDALNRGSRHYERLIEANLERAKALPANPGRRYILVDAASAMLWMYEDGQPVDSMRVIVGKPGEQTPMLAAYLRYAILNPYWNVPPDLVQRRIAPNVLDQGETYLRERGYEILSGWELDARPIEPASVDWKAVAEGREELRVRQLPGPGNMMGDAKFMISDDLGIYLHDTPDRDLFDAPDRRLSSGCIRLEDVSRLSEWLLGTAPETRSNAPEQRVDLPESVPVLITYLTIAPEADRLVFREDVYGRDRAALVSTAP